MTPDLRQCTRITDSCHQNVGFLQKSTIWTQNALLSPPNALHNTCKRSADFFKQKTYNSSNIPHKNHVLVGKTHDLPPKCRIPPKSSILVKIIDFWDKIDDFAPKWAPHPDSKSTLVDPCPVLPQQFWVFRRSLAPLKLRFREAIIMTVIEDEPKETRRQILPSGNESKVLKTFSNTFSLS